MVQQQTCALEALSLETKEGLEAGIAPGHVGVALCLEAVVLHNNNAVVRVLNLHTAVGGK